MANVLETLINCTCNKKTGFRAYPCKFRSTTATEERWIILHSSSHNLKAAARTKRADLRPTLQMYHRTSVVRVLNILPHDNRIKIFLLMLPNVIL